MRLVFGPAKADHTVARPLAPALLILTIGDIVDSDGIEVVPVAIRPHDVASLGTLVRVYVVYAPGLPTATDTPESFLATPGHFSGSIDLADAHAGTDGHIPVHGVPDGRYAVQTILGFDDTPAAPPAV